MPTRYLKWLWASLVFFTVILIGILFSEYRFLKLQTQKLLKLQEYYSEANINNSNKKILEIKKAKKKNDFCLVNRSTKYLAKNTDYHLRKHGIDVEYNYPRFNIWPINIKKFWISSFFGKRVERARGARFHSGLDLAALKGTKVYAVANGKVKEAKKIPGYGNSILLVHSNKYKTKYAHLDKILVKKNTKVKKGSIIGTVGDTGFVVKNGKDASHLHFEVIENGKQVNPLKFLPILKKRNIKK